MENKEKNISSEVSENECRKNSFSTEKSANKELKRIRSTRGKNKKPVRSYQCPFCDKWHLTSGEKDFTEKTPKKMKQKLLPRVLYINHPSFSFLVKL